jgi:hypothetical protein
MFKLIVQRKLNELHLKVLILLRIIMTVSVTTASAEKNFSRLKLMKA